MDGFNYAKPKEKSDLTSFERGLEDLQKELHYAQNNKSIRAYKLTSQDYELTLGEYLFNIGYVAHMKVK